MRFRISVNASGELRGQLGDLAQRLVNDLRVVTSGWDASRMDFKNGFILGSDRYYYIVKAGSPRLIDATTNNPKWAVRPVSPHASVPNHQSSLVGLSPPSSGHHWLRLPRGWLPVGRLPRGNCGFSLVWYLSLSLSERFINYYRTCAYGLCGLP